MSEEKRQQKTWYYSIDGHEDDQGFPFESKESCTTRWLAEACADDYHSNHDGWESSWPLTICFREIEGGPVVAKFEVDRETVPQFIARRKP